MREFLSRTAAKYEVVVFTASMGKYANPVIDMIDPDGNVKHRLFREACTSTFGAFVKDLSRLGRDVTQCIIIDNSPPAYRLHRSNAIPITSWFSDKQDKELCELLPYLDEIAEHKDVIAGLRKLRREVYKTPSWSRPQFSGFSRLR